MSEPGAIQVGGTEHKAMNDTRYVAVCDVLGFKQLIKTTTLDQLARAYERLVTNAKTLGTGQVYTNEGSHVASVAHCIFSDSIILWSKPFPGSDFRKDLDSPPGHFFLTTACRLVGLGIFAGFPLRIGIAFGECVMKPEKGIFLGTAIVDAYETEQRQEWAGAACHPSCLKAPYNEYHRGKRGYPSPMIRYNVPVKPGAANPALEWSIDWPKECFGDLRPILRANVEKLAGTASGNKWQNTLQYYEQRIAESLRKLRVVYVDIKTGKQKTMKWSADKHPLPPYLKPRQAETP